MSVSRSQSCLLYNYYTSVERSSVSLGKLPATQKQNNCARDHRHVRKKKKESKKKKEPCLAGGKKIPTSKQETYYFFQMAL